MIGALIAGERDPVALADLARGVLRKKIPDLTLALAGRFTDDHALVCRLDLTHIEHLNDMIGKLDTRIISFDTGSPIRPTMVEHNVGIGETRVMASLAPPMRQTTSPGDDGSWRQRCTSTSTPRDARTWKSPIRSPRRA
ncbi:hypothetical protein [Micromonospora chersina]|uniref:hypothetical protein n=1 Tax=Micromonospora chersina TaxID=47854 RepID=UPI003716321E